MQVFSAFGFVYKDLGFLEEDQFSSIGSVFWYIQDIYGISMILADFFKLLKLKPI